MPYPEPHNLDDIYVPGAENADDERAALDELEQSLSVPDWLPKELFEQERNLARQAAEAMDFDLLGAMAFCVALLEECNGHTEAKAINDLLRPMYVADKEREAIPQ